MSLSLVAYEDSSDSETEDVPTGGRSDSKPDRQSKEDVRKLLAVLPPAKGGGGRARGRGAKQPVRIGIPKLENEGDSDEEDIPVVKKPRMGKGTALTALLPEPKGAPRQLGATNKSTTKSMVPYSLTKKKQESKKPLPKSKPLRKKTASKNDGDDSDSDGEPVSFFSHLEDPQPGIAPPESDPAGEGDSVSKPDSSFPESGSTYPVIGYRTYGEPTSSSDSQSQWYAGQYDASAQGYSNFTGQTDPSTQGYTSGYTEWTEQSCSSAQGFTSGYTGQYTDLTRTEGGDSESAADTMPGPGPGLSIDQEVLRRLAGGSRLRGREKDLQNIIEINEDEVKEGIKVYQKYHTDDSINKLYQPDMSKVNAPSSMQKRKHQLGYLAHQAQARELELRNHWSQAAATRRQTQMKYGF